MWIAERREEGSHSLVTSRKSGNQRSGLPSIAQDGIVVAFFFGIVLWTTAGVAAEGSSFEARDVMTRGTVEVGLAAGFAQPTTAIGNAQSANRSAVFVLPRVGMVLTDPLGRGWWRGNVEVFVEPLFAEFTKPFAVEAAAGPSP